ncbi:MAG: hypothetical protein E7238_03840 [Sarcina sp.]|nr:hypothetical protein [Sarcina sp.]
MKKLIGIAAVIAVIVIAGFGYSIWSARKAADAAVESYNAVAQQYNEEIAPYNKAAAATASANEELQKVLDRAQTDIDSGQKAYDSGTLKELKSAREEAEKLLVEIPAQIDPLEMMSATDSLSRKEILVRQQEAEAAAAAVEEARAEIPETPDVPDYSEALKKVEEKCTAYENSVQMLKNITAPPDSFVRERLKKISTVVQTGTVTTGDDPNGLLGKNGGYTGCVYFLDSRVSRDLLPGEAFRDEEKGQDQAGAGATEAGAETVDTGATEEAATSATDATAAAAEESATSATDATAAAAEEPASSAIGATAAQESATSATGATAAAAEIAAEKPDEGPIDVVMIGTAGGGAVEVFASKEDAEKRMEYLAFFDGSVMENGSYEREGTCVIRASKYLSEDEQKELTREIREALLAVE